jgi:menaquinone-specific isochorismate synthase
VERKNSITLSSITNFLEAGALLRHGDQWILIEGPFKPACDAHSDEITVFCPDFYDLQSILPLRGTQTYCLSGGDLRQNCEAYLAQHKDLPPPMAKALWEEPAKEDFSRALKATQERIQKGEIQKTVPAVFARSPQTVTPVERAQMLLRLTSAPATLYVYGFWQNGEGVLGATPEVLFDYSQGRLKTMALAGTCPKSESSQRDSLLRDEKEMQEHLIVLEDLKTLLGPLGDLTTRGPDIVELPMLYHLKTDIEIVCKTPPAFLPLIEKLHPTPALGVAPRTYGYKWMQSFPGQEGRGKFGAPFAFFGEQEALCLVGIRNLQWNRTYSMIGSGCGVVGASELEREWRELYQKRLSVRKILGLEL